jgi:hypothetical protein
VLKDQVVAFWRDSETVKLDELSQRDTWKRVARPVTLRQSNADRLSTVYKSLVNDITRKGRPL